MNLKKYARVVNGKVDNIFETVNPISEEFPIEQVWVDITATAVGQVDYGHNAVNTDGVWSFAPEFPWSQSVLGEQLRNEKTRRFDNLITRVVSAGLQNKVDLGLATTAEQAYLVAFKQYCVAFTQVNKQPAFPTTIVWPDLP